MITFLKNNSDGSKEEIYRVASPIIPKTGDLIAIKGVTIGMPLQVEQVLHVFGEGEVETQVLLKDRIQTEQ